jgi:hypothetical protein
MAMAEGFVEMARDDIQQTMDRWHQIQQGPGDGSPPVLPEIAIREMIGRLVSDQIMLLRAVEEIEARP